MKCLEGLKIREANPREGTLLPSRCHEYVTSSTDAEQVNVTSCNATAVVFDG